jgi:hypothetical protein
MGVYCLKCVVLIQILDYLFIHIFDTLKTLFLKSASLTNIIITIRVNGIKFSVTMVGVSHKMMAN